MAKLILDDITDAPGFDVTVNSNSALIEAALENTLSRDGTGPNQMEAPLDMNSNRINNLADGIDQQDAVTIAQLIQASIAGPVSIGSLIDVDLTGILVGDILQWDGIQFLPVPLIVPQQATETILGIAELATQAETDAGADDLRIVTPLKLANLPQLQQATQTSLGIVEIANQSETNTGTDNDRAVTPLRLAGRTATEGRAGVIEIADQAEVDAGLDDTRAVTPAKLAAATTVGVTYKGCSIYRSTSWTLGNHPNAPPTGEVACPFDMEIIDTGVADFGTEYHSTSIQITRITIPAGVNRVRLGGGYTILQSAQNPGHDGSGQLHCRIRKNGNSFLGLHSGTDHIPWVTTNMNNNPQEHGVYVESGIISVSTGDYFELMGMVQGANAPNLEARSGVTFTMEVID